MGPGYVLVGRLSIILLGRWLNLTFQKSNYSYELWSLQLISTSKSISPRLENIVSDETILEEDYVVSFICKGGMQANHLIMTCSSLVSIFCFSYAIVCSFCCCCCCCLSPALFLLSFIYFCFLFFFFFFVLIFLWFSFRSFYF